MSDSRHKKSRDDGPTELNTATFRAEAADVLRRNRELNRLGGRRKKGDPGYLIESHADIADKLGIQQRMVDKVLGPVRPGTKLKLAETSVYIKPIREMLELVQVEIAVPVDRADVIARISKLPDAEFAIYRESIEKRHRP